MIYCLWSRDETLLAVGTDRSKVVALAKDLLRALNVELRSVLDGQFCARGTNILFKGTAEDLLSAFPPNNSVCSACSEAIHVPTDELHTEARALGVQYLCLKCAEAVLEPKEPRTP